MSWDDVRHLLALWRQEASEHPSLPLVSVGAALGALLPQMPRQASFIPFFTAIGGLFWLAIRVDRRRQTEKHARIAAVLTEQLDVDEEEAAAVADDILSATRG